jgi:hypothetical protein
LVLVSVAGLLLALLNVPPALAQPANDDFDSATAISALPFTDTISTVDATTAGDDPSCNGNEHSVWYSFTPTQDVTLRADTSGSDYATSLGVYIGSRGALSQVACASFPAEVTFNASANTTIFFMVASACCGGPGGTLAFNLVRLEPPANNDFDSATAISALPFTDTISTVAATAAGDDPSCTSNEHSVWYAFTPTQDVTVRADASSGDYNPSLGVYTGSRGALSEVACGFFPAQVTFNASANTTYFFMVASAFGGPGGTLAFNLVELHPPANDDFDSATVISALPFTDNISTVDATTAGDDPSCNGNEHSVWYAFTPTQDTPIRADTAGSDYATSLSVYTGSRGAFNQVACASFPAEVSFNATANTTYFFMVASACCGNPGGNLVFRVNPPPANDDFDNATVVDAVPFEHSMFTAGATAAADDPSCNGNAHSVWYAFTPTRDLPVRADTSGSDYATSLGVYTGSRGALSEVACASSPAEVAFDASANTTYFFMIASTAGSPGGTLVFHVSEGPPTLTASLTGSGTLVAKGAAVDVGVAYSCSPGLDGAMVVDLTQRVGGQRLATGFGVLRDFVCDRAEHTAAVRVIAKSVAFKKGDAVGDGFFEGCTFTCISVGLPRTTIHIK